MRTTNSSLNFEVITDFTNYEIYVVYGEFNCTNICFK